MDIRLSRHTKNKLRLYKLSLLDIEEAINAGERLNQGNKMESRLRRLRIIWVTNGSYSFVITVIRTG
jgi:hypothetical protein